jgi:phosphotransferase system  glucose/maltose/N-acetylglucosamine-specific IIC component
MLIIALLGAFFFYVALYLIWESTQSRLDSVAAVLQALNNMMWVPPNLVFAIFRGVLFLATCYVVLDLFISATKRATRKRGNKEKNELSWKKPPRID